MASMRLSIGKISALAGVAMLAVGSMSIIKRSKNLENAKKFYDWALTPAAQKIGVDTKNFQTLSNRAAPVPAGPLKMSEIKLINYDFAKYGGAAERKRLLDKWDKEVYALPKSLLR